MPNDFEPPLEIQEELLVSRIPDQRPYGELIELAGQGHSAAGIRVLEEAWVALQELNDPEFPPEIRQWLIELLAKISHHPETPAGQLLSRHEGRRPKHADDLSAALRFKDLQREALMLVRVQKAEFPGALKLVFHNVATSVARWNWPAGTTPTAALIQKWHYELDAQL